MLVVVLFIAHFWVINLFNQAILDEAERRAEISADGVINGMNMLMVTGMISNPDNRRLFIRKMGASENVSELRIIRAKQVQDQFGPGLPEEQARDDMDRRAIESKKPQFQLSEDHGMLKLRAVVPFIASNYFRGTNCLLCHHVQPGSVNGAASITIDLTNELNKIKHTKDLLILGHIMLQILLFFAINWLINRFTRPIVKLQSTMESMQLSGSMEQFVPVKLEQGEQDEIGKLGLAFNQMSEALSNSERSMKLAASIYQSNADAIMVTDENNLIVDVNPAFTRITGYTLDEVRGKNPRIMQSGKHDNEFYRHMWQAILNEGHWQGEIWDKRKTGEIYAKLAHISILRRSDGGVYRHVAQFSDITEKKQKDELIFWQANYDALTCLPNRRLLNDRLAHALAANKRNEDCGALMFLDLDKFKTLNDTLGHAYGDMLLVEVARRIKSCVREVDTVARIGGDEFVVLLENLGADIKDATQAAAHIAEKIRASLSTPYQLHDKMHHSSPSIGVSLIHCNGESAEELIKQADMAMYQAKEAGRNAVRFFDPQMQQSVETIAALESDLRHAVHERQLQLFYQIQLDHTHHPVGAEALLRWIHPVRGMVSPAQFIPFAEESSLILDIGHWVLDEACRQIAAWSHQERTRDLVLAVNISARQFKQPDFVEQVGAMIRKHAIQPARLKLELTESIALEELDVIITKMHALRNGLGISLSLDDFGTGYSSLSYLKRLPLDQIKIDQSFVRDMTVDSGDAVMVKTIIDMAHNFGIEVIAEGVETAGQFFLLKQYGCLLFQGYLFGRPVPLREFEALLQQTGSSAT
ncbi:EAL domain-containing protein [Sideroxydans lithotrophicus]|uniref:Diguanylate cyclase/phosphodiesterase with PAS/PAC sensor(S) n=1 Tax=Sideroxydans lithotrophicus (strain ES-1) TaxID=580332 RepID=D5CLH6_SIDLE|nr:EAL domain-containing protein [Sideroxydans lithotrophicus]ADE10564.1 diguanylate cyclase/phosphodiesterase with PAS/PAC sensor(s) [Sideroxydans lithotrophicus ES-1]